MENPLGQKESIIGCILGTAVGDAYGLALEGLSKQRQKKLFPNMEGHHFFFGKGMVSDDTEHTCMVAQALIASAGDPVKFRQDLAWRLRWWFLCLPAAMGYATLVSMLKLWLGFPADKSGIFSAGNGPAMRSAVIGVCAGHDEKKLKELVRISTRMTHRDPKAEFGALAVALAAYLNQKELSPSGFLQQLSTLLQDENAEEFLDLIQKTVDSVARGQTTESFAADMGWEKGVSGYIYQTVPAVIHVWLRHPRDYQSAIQEMVRCGGDSDTTGAILGGIVGAGAGKGGIPEKWLNTIWEWPRSTHWMERLAEQLYCTIKTKTIQKPITLPFVALFLRNLFFLAIVLLHGFRRMLPPY